MSFIGKGDDVVDKAEKEVRQEVGSRRSFSLLISACSISPNRIAVCSTSNAPSRNAAEHLRVVAKRGFSQLLPRVPIVSSIDLFPPKRNLRSQVLLGTTPSYFHSPFDRHPGPAGADCVSSTTTRTLPSVSHVPLGYGRRWSWPCSLADDFSSPKTISKRTKACIVRTYAPCLLSP